MMATNTHKKSKWVGAPCKATKTKPNTEIHSCCIATGATSIDLTKLVLCWKGKKTTGQKEK